jgi:hypothetical protein
MTVQSLSNPADGSGVREVAFFAADVPDMRTLIDGLRPGVAYHVLSPHGDGLAEMATFLAGYRDLEALHIVSHGAPGKLFVSDTAIDSTLLGQRGRILEAIRAHLAGDAEIWLYGCDVGQKFIGKEFIQRLKASLASTIVFSTTKTGSSNFGGDWTFKHIGNTPSQEIALSSQSRESFNAILAIGDTVNFQDLAASASSPFIDSGFKFTESSGDTTTDDFFGDIVLETNSQNATSYTITMVENGSGADFILDTLGWVHAPLGNGPSIQLEGFNDGSSVVGPITLSDDDDSTNPGGSMGAFPSTAVDEVEISFTGDGSSFQFNTFETSAANAAPVITLPGTPTFDEDSSGNAISDTLDISDGDSDSQAVSLAVTNGTATLGTTTNLANLVGNGTSTISFDASPLSDVNNALDSLTFTPTANFDGTASIQVQTDDGNGGTDDQTLDITVNDAPEVSSINRGTSPGSQTTNADTVEFDVTFSEAVNGIDTSDFTLTGAASGSINSVSAASGTSVTVTVGSVTGDGTLGLDLADDDSIVSDDGNNTLLGGVGTSGDGDGSHTGDQSFTIDNSAPTLASTASTDFAENGTGTVLDIGADDGSGADTNVTYSLTGGADQADFNLNSTNGQLTFGSAPDFENPADDDTNNDYVVDVTAADSAGNTTVQTVTVTVTDVDENPSFASATSTSFAENGTGTVIDVNATDGDGGASDANVTYSLTGSGADNNLFSIDANSGAVTFDSAPDFETPGDTGTNNVYDIQVQADDSSNQVTQDIAITVTDLNEAPTDITLGSSTVNQSGGTDAVVGSLDATDPDTGDTHTFSLVSGTGDGDNGSFNINGTDLRADDAGSLDAGMYNIRLEADDGAGGTFQKALTVTVNDDVAPGIASVSTNVTGDTISDGDLGNDFTITVNFDEAMNQGVNPSSVGFPTGGEDPSNTITGGGPSYNFVDADTLEITYASGDLADANEVVQDVDIKLNGIEDAAGNSTDVTQADVFSIITAPAPTISSITSTTADDTYGVGDSVNVTVTFDEAVDFTANSGSLDATLSNGETVTLANSNFTSQTTVSGTYTIGAGETDSADLNVTSVSLADGATLVANDDGVPADLSVPSGNNLADNQALVIDANTPGVSAPDLTAATDTGTANDDDITKNATPTITGTTDANATVSVRVGGAEVNTTTADGSGDWSYTFGTADLSESANTVDIKASDAAGNTSSDSADLTLTLDTTAPTAADDTSATVQENDSAATLTGVNGSGDNVTANDTDAAGTTPVTAVNGSGGNLGSGVAGDNGGLFTVAADGSVSFDPNGDFDALATGDTQTTGITLTIQDTAGNTDTSTLSVDVTGANTAPTLTIGTPPTVETGNTITLDAALLNETDPDDDGADLTYTLTSAPGSGTLALSGKTLTTSDTFTQQDVIDGDLRFTAGSSSGTASFEVDLRDDSAGGPAAGTIEITVEDPPPPPPPPSPDPEPDPEPNEDDTDDDGQDDDLFDGSDDSDVDNDVDTGLNQTDDFENTTIDGATGTTGNTTDRDTGESVEVTSVNPVTDGEREEEDETTSDVDVPITETVRASISENTGLIATRRTSDSRDSLRTVIDRDDASGGSDSGSSGGGSASGGSGGGSASGGSGGGSASGGSGGASGGTDTSAEDEADREAFLDEVTGGGSGGGLDVVEITPTRPAAETGSGSGSGSGGDGERRIRVTIDAGSGGAGGDGSGAGGDSGGTGDPASRPLVIVDTRNLADESTGTTTQQVDITGAGSVVVRGGGSFRGTEELASGGAPDVDNVLGDNSAQVLFFGPGDDTIRGRGGDDFVSSAGGDDRLFGGSGNDTVSGGSGADTLTGGSGADTLMGDAGDDTISGGVGDDTASGGSGADTLDGGAGADTLMGGAGDDTLMAGGGDTLVGGIGGDTIDLTGLDGDVTLTDLTTDDTLIFGDVSLSREDVSVETVTRNGEATAVLRLDLDGDGARGDDPAVTLTRLAEADVAVAATEDGGTAITLTGADMQFTNLSAQDQLSALYLGFLDRAPDTGGLAFWQGELADALAEGRGLRTALNDIAESIRLDTETGTLETGGAIQPDGTPDEAGVEAFVTEVFQRFFGRDPGAEGLGFWTETIMSRMEEGRNMGDTVVDIAAGALDAAGVDQDGDGTMDTTVNDATTLRNRIELAQQFAAQQEDGAVDLDAGLTLADLRQPFDSVADLFASFEAGEATVQSLIAAAAQNNDDGMA